MHTITLTRSTYLNGPRLFLTHRSSKHVSKVLTAIMTATIPVIIAVMSTVLSFSMVPIPGGYDSST